MVMTVCTELGKVLLASYICEKHCFSSCLWDAGNKYIARGRISDLCPQLAAADGGCVGWLMVANTWLQKQYLLVLHSFIYLEYLFFLLLLNSYVKYFFRG